MSFGPTKTTNKFLKDLLKGAHKDLSKAASEEAWNISDIWNQVVGEKMAQLSQVKSFNEGILVIKVTSAPLCQLLSTTEKPKILAKMKTLYPQVKIKTLVFRTS